MFESYRKNMIAQLTTCKRCYGTTYSWDPNKRKYILLRAKRDTKLYNIMSVFIGLNVLCMVFSHFYNGRSSSSGNVFLQTLSLHIVGVAVAAGITRLIPNGQESSEDIVQLLNEMNSLPETSNNIRLLFYSSALVHFKNEMLTFN
jgi:hypothetical protein